MSNNERFHHDDQTSRQVFDARENPSGAITEKEVFYVGYRVSNGNAMWYHHAVILADTSEKLLGGSMRLSGQIWGNIDGDAKIVPVFARSLMASNPDVIDSAYRTGITQEIKQYLDTKQQNGFMVFGIAGDSEIILMNVPEQDAMTAILSAGIATKQQKGKELFPIDVCQAHAVTSEFSARFDAAVQRIRTLLADAQTATSLIH